MVLRQAIVGLVLTTCVHAAAFAEPPRQAMSIYKFASEYGYGMNMEVPQNALRLEDIERWARMLELSEAQRQFLLLEYGRFVERHDEFVRREAPRYLDVGKELLDLWHAGEHSTQKLATLARRVDRESARLRREMTALEHSLIDALDPVLTDEQRVRALLVRLEARRRNCRGPVLSSMRWSDVELRYVWYGSAAAMASPQERERVEAILAVYEPQLTTIICRMIDQNAETRQQLTANRIARFAGTVSPADGRARARDVGRRKLKTHREVRLLNERTVEQIALALSPDLARIFIATAKAEAFYELYPDPETIHALFGSLAGDDELDDEQRALVKALTVAYEAEYTQHCERLEAFCIEWGERNTEGVYGYHRQFLGQELKPLLEERTELSWRSLVMLVEHVGMNALMRHATAIPETFRPRLAEHVDTEAVGPR
jgi:hypothetical protein